MTTKEIMGKRRWAPLLLAALSAGAGLVACSTGRSGQEIGKTLQQAQLVSQTILLPQVALSQESLLIADKALYVGDRVEVDGGTGAIAVATGVAQVGVEARVGRVWSGGTVDIRDKAKVSGPVEVTGAYQLGNDLEPQPVVHTSSVPLDSVTVSPPDLGTSQGQVSLEPGQERTLEPGRFGELTLKRGSRLRLETGEYVFSNATINTEGIIEIDSGCGPVTVYFEDGFIFRGSIVESSSTVEPAGLAVVQLGGSTVHIEAPFNGSVLAPRAEVILNSATHTGHFRASTLRVQPDAVILPPGGATAAAVDCPALLSVQGDSRCDGRYCCPDGMTAKTLEGAPRGCRVQEAEVCVIGGAGSDVVGPARGQTSVFYGFGTSGDDYLQGGTVQASLIGGAGDDRICGRSTQGSKLIGGDGNDVLLALSGNNTVYPGAGADTVQLGPGNDKVVIVDPCEVSAGETIDFGEGDNTLLSSATPEELMALGLTILGEFEHETVYRRCGSSCAALPQCEADEKCVDMGADGLACSPRSPTYADQRPSRDWPRARADIRSILNEFYAAFTTSTDRAHVLQTINQLRARASEVAYAVLDEYENTPYADPDWRHAQVVILSWLDDPMFIGILRTLALEPDQYWPVPDAHEAPNPNLPYLTVRIQAAQGLARMAIAGHAEADAALLEIVEARTGYLQETAALGYLSAGRSQQRLDALAARAPADAAHWAQLQVLSKDFPQPPHPQGF